MKTDLASVRDAYWSFGFAVSSLILDLNLFVNAKTMHDFLPAILLLFLGYFFLNKSLKICSLSYENDVIYIRKIWKGLNVPFENVLEIKRERGTTGGGAEMSFGYRIFYMDEDLRKSFSTILVRTDKIAGLKILADKIRAVNPSLIINI